MEKLTQMMVGKTVPTRRRRPHPIGAEEVLQVRASACRAVAAPLAPNATFSIRSGEVLGVAGIEGNGQTPLAQALLGLLPPLFRQHSPGRTGNHRPHDQTRFRMPAWAVFPVTGKAWALSSVCGSLKEKYAAEYLPTKKPYAKSPLLEDWAAARRDAKAESPITACGRNEVGCGGILSGGNQRKSSSPGSLTGLPDTFIATQPPGR